MRKLICDRCGNEVDALVMLKIPSESKGNGDYTIKTIEVCNDCNRYINKSKDAFNESLVNTRIAFYKAIIPSCYKEGDVK